jgi:NADPH-dependent F420 reductase
MTTIAIIGTGNVGGALGTRLAQSGLPVVFGSRGDASELVAKAGSTARAASQEQAAKEADVVFLAIPANVAVEVASKLPLEGKIVVDCNNPLRWDAGPVWAPPAEGSLAAAIAKAAPGARVLKAFNQFGAEFHADPNIAGQQVDVFIAGDDAAAKKTLSELASKAGFSPIDAGPLRNAAVLETLAILWIHLALAGGQGRNVAFKLLRR